MKRSEDHYETEREFTDQIPASMWQTNDACPTEIGERVTSWDAFYVDEPDVRSRRRSWESWDLPDDTDELANAPAPAHQQTYRPLYVRNPDLELAPPSPALLPQEPVRPPSPSLTNFTDWRSISGSESGSVNQDCDSLETSTEPRELGHGHRGQEAEEDSSDSRSASSNESAEHQIMNIPAVHDSYYDQIYVATAIHRSPSLDLDKPLPGKPSLVRQLSLKGLKKKLSSLSLTKKRANSFPSTNATTASSSSSEPRSSSSRPSTPSPLAIQRSLTTPSPILRGGMVTVDLQSAAMDMTIKYRGI